MKILLLLFLLSSSGEVQDVRAFPGFSNMKSCMERAAEAEAYYAQQNLLVKAKCVTDI